MAERSAEIEDRLGPSLEPGSLHDHRYRIASVASRSTSDLLFNALDERSRQRIRLRVTSHPIVAELAALRHPAIVTVLREFSVRTGEGRWSAAVLEWFDGLPLTLPAAPLADLDEVRAWASRVAGLLDALEHVHRTAGRAHGDLGLRSLWTDRDGGLRLVDLSAPDGVVAGESLPYASPERLRGNPRDPRSDIYSVAAIAYALATGSPPYGSDANQARTGHLLWRVPEHPALPPAFLAILRTAMEKQPHHRFASAARMKDALEQAIRGLDAGAVPSAHGPERIPVVPSHSGPFEPDLDGSIAEDLLSLDRSMEPPPIRSRAARPRAAEPAVGARLPATSPLLVPLALSAVGLALSVFAWAALLGLLAAVGSGRLAF